MDDLDDQAEEVRGRGKRQSGGARIDIRDGRLSKIIEWILPIIATLALAVILYFANKVGQLGDALNTTNTQIAVMIKQNDMMQDGFKDHENRIRALEGTRFRGVPGYGELNISERTSGRTSGRTNGR